MLPVQLEVEFVAGRQVLSDGAYTAAADDDQHDVDVDRVWRRPRRRRRHRLTRPHLHPDPVHPTDADTQRSDGYANEKALIRGKPLH